MQEESTVHDSRHLHDAVSHSPSILLLSPQGSEGFGSQIDKCMGNADYLFEKLQNRTDFELVLRSKVSVRFPGL